MTRGELKETIRCSLFDEQEIEDIMAAIDSYSSSSANFIKAITLLRDLADLQNGAPLEQERKQWEETMTEVYKFLNKWE